MRQEFLVIKYCSGVLAAALMVCPWGGQACAADVPSSAVVVVVPSDPLPATRDEEIRQDGENAVISVRYPVFGVPALDEDMVGWARSIAESFQQDVSGMESAPESGQKSSLEATYAIHAPSAGAVSVTFTVWSYIAGAAHGAVDIRTRSYDLATGVRLELADIFEEPDKALELMSACAHADLRKQIGEETDAEWLRNGTLPDAENFSSVALTPAGVHIFFQAYQVGPWAIGPQEVDVPLGSLREARPRMALWNKTVSPPARTERTVETPLPGE